MTDEELRAIEERASKATPGPWSPQSGGYYEYGTGGKNHILEEWFVMRPDDDVAICSECLDPETSEPHEGNAAFIAHAREDIPQLLAEVRRLQGEVDELVRREELGIREVGDLATEAEGLREELARYKWTRVSEGLPETEGTYWVVYQTPAQLWTAEQKFKDGAFNTPWPRFITHWMHIPPVEGEEDEQ